jgi:hypothetical protein
VSNFVAGLHNGSFDAYLTLLEKDSTFGDEATLLACSIIYSIEITIVSTLPQGNPVHTRTPDSPINARITLIHIPECHYLACVPARQSLKRQSQQQLSSDDTESSSKRKKTQSKAIPKKTVEVRYLDSPVATLYQEYKCKHFNKNDPEYLSKSEFYKAVPTQCKRARRVTGMFYRFFQPNLLIVA